MKIQQVNTRPVVNQQQSPQFKSAYPVVHWVAEQGGSYAPVTTMDLTKKLQRVLVSLFNKSTDRLHPTGMEVVEYLSKCDTDYRHQHIARSFYDRDGGYTPENKFNPISYLITGLHCKNFNDNYGKTIGKSKSKAPVIAGKRVSTEANIAIRDYMLNGKRYVQDPRKKVYDSDGIACALHTKFNIIRTKTGKIKGYELVDIKFCPEEGANNPFVRVGILPNKPKN
jgi:hypothetical protein